MIGQTTHDYELIGALAAQITTRFCRTRIPTDDGSSAYWLRIDLEMPVALESDNPRGLVTEALQRIGTEILSGLRGLNQDRSANRSRSVMTDVVRLWVCYHSASVSALMVLMEEILAHRLGAQEIVVSENGGAWTPYTALTGKQAA